MQESVFINYRRQSDSGIAGRIDDSLSRALPGASIFMDVDKLSPGDDFEVGLPEELGKLHCAPRDHRSPVGRTEPIRAASAASTRRTISCARS